MADTRTSRARTTATVTSTPSRRDPLIGHWREYEPDLGLSPVLAAALDLFVELGYHGTSVRDIATRAGLSVPGLYHHHPSKQHILATLLARSGQEALDRSIAAVASAGREPRARFIAQVENIVLYMIHRTRYAHLAREIHCLEAPFHDRHMELRDLQEGLLLTNVTTAHQHGAFTTDDPREATRAVLVLCRGVADWFTPGGEYTPEEIAAKYIRFALALVEDRPG